MRTRLLYYLGVKGLILKRRTQNRDHKDPGICNTGAFKMNVSVKKIKTNIHHGMVYNE